MIIRGSLLTTFEVSNILVSSKNWLEPKTIKLGRYYSSLLEFWNFEIGILASKCRGCSSLDFVESRFRFRFWGFLRLVEFGIEFFEFCQVQSTEPRYTTFWTVWKSGQKRHRNWSKLKIYLSRPLSTLGLIWVCFWTEKVISFDQKFW